jgi:hypothetical protein
MLRTGAMCNQFILWRLIFLVLVAVGFFLVLVVVGF